MKKVILLVSVVGVILFIAMSALTKIPNIQKTNGVGENKTNNTIELNFAHHMPEISVLHQTAMRYANEIFKKTNSKVKITVFPNQILGNSQEMLELSRQGDIDILITPTAKMSIAIPSMQYADLPFLFSSNEDTYALLDGKVGDMLLRNSSNIDLLGVAFWEGGFKNFTSNKPLTKIEDFKDLKIRVMKSRIVREQFYALGANPVAIDFHETKQALKDGAVDAQENPLNAIVDMKFYEVQTDVTLSNHAFLAYVLTLSKKTILKLPLDIQNILIQTGKEIRLWHRQDKKHLNVIKAANLNIHELSPLEKQRFKQATSYIIKQYEDVIGSHIISKTEEYFYKKYPKDNIVTIGIDADLSMGAKGSGLAIKRGVELAVNEINKNGGLLGKQVVIVAKDHQGVSTQAKENIKEFIDDKNIIGVIGGKHSSIISSYTKDIQDNKLIFFSPWAAATCVTDNGYKDNYIFRVSLNDKYATNFLAQEALEKSSNPAIIVENSIWGKGALKNINLYLHSKGLQKQEGIIINRGENKFEEVFTNVLRKNYDSIIIVLNSQEAQRMITYMGSMNIKMPIISHWGIVGDSFFEANKNYLKDIDLRFIQTFSLLNNTTKESQNLAQNYFITYHKASNKKINAITGVVQAYDSVMLLAQAIQKSNSFDSRDVKNSLENLGNYDGLIKRYKNPFNKVDHDALGIEDFFMAKFDKNGNVIPLDK